MRELARALPENAPRLVRVHKEYRDCCHDDEHQSRCALHTDAVRRPSRFSADGNRDETLRFIYLRKRSNHCTV